MIHVHGRIVGNALKKILLEPPPMSILWFHPCKGCNVRLRCITHQDSLVHSVVSFVEIEKQQFWAGTTRNPFNSNKQPPRKVIFAWEIIFHICKLPFDSRMEKHWEDSFIWICIPGATSKPDLELMFQTGKYIIYAVFQSSLLYSNKLYYHECE